MVLTAATEPLLPALMKPLLDGSFVHKEGPSLYWVPFAIMGLFLVRGALTYITSYAFSWLNNNLLVDLRNAMFRRMAAFPTSYFDNHSAGELISKIAIDVMGVNAAATTVLTVLVRDSLTVVGLLAWLLYLNWKLTLVTLIIAPPVALVIRLTGRRLRRMSSESLRAMGDVTHLLEEAIEGQKVMKIFGGQAYEARRFDRANRVMRGYNMRQSIAAGVTTPLVQFFAAAAVAIIIGIAIRHSASEQFTVGEFVSFLTAMLMLLAPLKHLSDINAPLQRGLACAERVFSLMDEEPEGDAGTVELGRARGHIRFERVGFRYPGAARDALDDVDLVVEPGQTVALVGPSGGGKTTLVNLLPRFYSVARGRILLDGHDLASLTLASIRANIAMVSQDVMLFDDTIAANIAYGEASGASREALERAASMAHALEFIRELPEGFETTVGEKGMKLSGGQRQRIAIARAFLKDAPILILDEATSALDSESEHRVQSALATLMRGRTTLVIAHRLSTVERADRIVVLSRGRVVESGAHRELLARDGLYAKLYRIQFAERDEYAPPGRARGLTA
jgi:subfamily B ATP-binding cassette protein MsbA